jgi:hypothetical protein
MVIEKYYIKARNWFDRAKNTEDPWFQFVLLYISFEIMWKILDIKKYKLNNTIERRFLSEKNKEIVNVMKSYINKNRLRNMTKREQPYINFNNLKDFQKVLKFVNIARNNLFHGDKELDAENDIKVIELGNKLLMPLIETMFDYYKLN